MCHAPCSSQCIAWVQGSSSSVAPSINRRMTHGVSGRCMLVALLEVLQALLPSLRGTPLLVRRNRAHGATSTNNTIWAHSTFGDNGTC